MERTRVRLQLEFPDSMLGLIQDLMSVTGIRTQNEFFDSALALFKWAVDERRAGRQIASLDRARWLHREIHIPALDSVITTARTVEGTVTEKVAEQLSQ